MEDPPRYKAGFAETIELTDEETQQLAALEGEELEKQVTEIINRSGVLESLADKFLPGDHRWTIDSDSGQVDALNVDDSGEGMVHFRFTRSMYEGCRDRGADADPDNGDADLLVDLDEKKIVLTLPEVNQRTTYYEF